MNRRHFRQERPGGLWLPERRIVRPRAGTIFIGGASEPAVITQRATYIDATNLTTYTSGSLATGTASPDRVNILGFHTRRTGTTSIVAVTINGVSATQLVAITSTDRAVALYIAANPTGTTAVCSVEMGQAQDGIGMHLWSVTGLESLTAVGTDPQTVVGTVLAFDSTPTLVDGIAVGIVGGQDAASAQTFTWATMTERHDQTIEGVHTYTAADMVTTGANIAPTTTVASGATLQTGVIASLR